MSRSNGPGLPRVTVLVPTYDREAFLVECIASLLQQTLPPHQIIVVNDGATDATAAALAHFGSAVQEIRIAQSGKPGAVNAGLPYVTGDYLWIFDDDDVALPDALERFVAPLERHPEHGFSYSTFHYCRSRPGKGLTGDGGHISWIPDVERRGFLVPLLESNFLGGAALFARTSCYERVGAFDLSLIRSQDYDMAIRIARAYSGIRVPGPPTFLYRQHDGARGSSQDRFDAAAQARKWLEYDQIIFRRLYRQLPLADYLPPGADSGVRRREALLQRMVVSASKLLFEEVVADLNLLGELSASPPLTRVERSLIHRIIRVDPYYGPGGVLKAKEVFETVGRLSERSQLMRQIRLQVVRALSARAVAFRSARRGDFIRAVGHAARTYLAARTEPTSDFGTPGGLH